MATYLDIDQQYIGSSIVKVPNFEAKFVSKLEIFTPTPTLLPALLSTKVYYHVYEQDDSHDIDVHISLGLFNTKEQAQEYILDIIKTRMNIKRGNDDKKYVNDVRKFNCNLFASGSYFGMPIYYIESLQLLE